MKKRWRKNLDVAKKRIGKIFLPVVVCIWTYTMDVSATTASGKLTTSLSNFTSLIFTVLAGIGTIYLALGIFDFASALSGHDPSQQKQGLTRIVSGLMMISVKLITTFIQ